MPGADLQQLIDLLLILDNGDIGFGMIDDEAHLLGDRVLIDGDRHGTQHLRGADRPVKLWPVIADDGDAVAAFYADGGKARGDPAHFAVHLRPGPALPDAVIFLA